MPIPFISLLLPRASASGWRVPTRGSSEAGFESRACFAARNVKKSPAGAGLFTRGLNFSRKPGCSVANLDARSIPNASIPIPNGCASGPVAVRCHVHGPGRYVHGGRLIIAWAARYRRSKQCTHGQAANNAGGYLTTACDRRLGCNRQTKAACDEQTDEKLSHFGPPSNGVSLFTPN